MSLKKLLATTALLGSSAIFNGCSEVKTQPKMITDVSFEAAVKTRYSETPMARFAVKSVFPLYTRRTTDVLVPCERVQTEQPFDFLQGIYTTVASKPGEDPKLLYSYSPAGEAKAKVAQLKAKVACYEFEKH